MKEFDSFPPEIHPANYEMKKNPVRPISTTQTTITEDIDLNDADALRKLAKGALVEIVQKAPRNISLVGAIRELLDRVDGKPAQSQAIELKVKGEVEHYHNVELSSELLKEQLQRILKKPVMIEQKS